MYINYAIRIIYPVQGNQYVSSITLSLNSWTKFIIIIKLLICD